MVCRFFSLVVVLGMLVAMMPLQLHHSLPWCCCSWLVVVRLLLVTVVAVARALLRLLLQT